MKEGRQEATFLPSHKRQSKGCGPKQLKACQQATAAPATVNLGLKTYLSSVKSGVLGDHGSQDRASPPLNCCTSFGLEAAADWAPGTHEHNPSRRPVS